MECDWGSWSPGAFLDAFIGSLHVVAFFLSRDCLPATAAAQERLCSLKPSLTELSALCENPHWTCLALLGLARAGVATAFSVGWI